MKRLTSADVGRPRCRWHVSPVTAIGREAFLIAEQLAPVN